MWAFCPYHAATKLSKVKDKKAFMNYGYITVASAIPQVRVADVDYNVEQIERFVVDADKRGVEILVFPELSVTGY